MRATDLPRRGLILALALVLGLGLGACETSSEKKAAVGRAEAPADRERSLAGPAGRETDVRGSLGQLRAPRPSVEEQDVRTSGLEGPEFYHGNGVLARDSGASRVDVVLGENGRVTLNFANAEIRDVIDIVLGDTLNLSYIIDPAVQGSVTVRTSQPLSREAVIPALENILALNGVAMTLVEGTYMIVPQEIAAKGLSRPLVSPTQRQLARGFGINIIPLNYASAAAMLQILEPFVAPGSLRADEARNLMIFSGKSQDALDLIDMIDVFDVDWMRGMSFALLPVDVADVKELVGELETVFLQDGKSPLAGMIRFAPIERLNAVLVISSQPAYLDRAQTWVERLDRGAEGAGRRIFVYYVENGRAEDLAGILNDVFAEGKTQARALPRGEVAPGLTPVELGRTTQRARTTQQTAAAEGQPAAAEATTRREQRLARPIQQSSTAEGIGGVIPAGGDIRVIADDATNSLVILATASEFRMIEATLKKLDIIPLQVLIEATILQVTLNDKLEYGVQWFFESGNFLTQFIDTGVGVAGAGFTFLFDANDKGAVLTALSNVTDTKVISSPQIMVLDNQSARLQVGNQVPFLTSATDTSVDISDQTGSATNVGVAQFQQIDTGVVLNVSPRINAGGLVVLEITQEVSNVADAPGIGGNPIIFQRQIESTIAVQSGHTVALGGLISDDHNEAVIGVPILSDIPILGNLFKTTSDTTIRDELLVLITPRVVRNEAEARRVTEELRKRLKNIEPLEQRIFAPEGS